MKKKYLIFLAASSGFFYSLSVFCFEMVDKQQSRWHGYKAMCEISGEEIENRYIFAGGFSWITKSGADTLVKRAKEAGFNIIVPAVWKGRGAGWPTEKVRAETKWIKSGVNKNHDPLEYLIKIAHIENIEIHPWFTLSKRQADFMPIFHDSGTPNNFFNIHNPEFRELIASLVGEVVANYNVDGINLDYVRSGGVCDSEMCQKIYYQETKHNLSYDKSVLKFSQKARDRIIMWNRAAVDQLIAGVVSSARKSKPGLIISVDTHLDVAELQVQGVNSKKWLESGAIDLIFQMQYQTVEDKKLQEINNIASKFEKPEKVILLVGNFLHSTKKKKGRKIIKLPGGIVADFVSRGQKFSKNGNGVGLFEYSILTDDQIDAIRAGPFMKNTQTNSQCFRKSAINYGE